MLEGSVSLEQVEAVRRESFLKQARGFNYPVTRGLYGRIIHHMDNNIYLDGYSSDLPTFQDKNVDGLIEARIKEFGRMVDILDVGCGVGKFLLDSERTWPGMVSVSGITTYREDPETLKGNLDPDDIDDLKDLSERAVIVGDAQRLEDYYEENSFDIVVSDSVGNYMADPMSMVEGMYRGLRAEGIGLVNYLPNASFSWADKALLFKFLQSKFRMEISMSERFPYFSLAFQKEKPFLNLPLTYKEIDVTYHNHCGLLPVLNYGFRNKDASPVELAWETIVRIKALSHH